MQHIELGNKLMTRIIEDIKDIGKVETHLNLRKTDGNDYSA